MGEGVRSSIFLTFRWYQKVYLSEWKKEKKNHRMGWNVPEQLQYKQITVYTLKKINVYKGTLGCLMLPNLKV